MNHSFRNECWLLDLHWGNEISISQMAQLCGCHMETIRRWMIKFKIPGRNIKGQNNQTRQGVNKTCEWCGKIFYVTHSRRKQKCCSRICGGKLRTKKITVYCTICGKRFSIVSSKTIYGYGKFCSRKCAGEWRSIYYKESCGPGWKGGKVKYLCDECDKPFFVAQYRIKKDKKIFCSRKCKDKNHSKNMDGENNSNWRGGKMEVLCKNCGHKILRMVCKLRIYKNSFCSTKCVNEYKSKMFMGTNNPNWYGGVSFEPYGVEFNKKLKKQIKERDKYVCQVCRFTAEQLNENLSIHHIDRNKQNNTISNLITLCSSCHGTVHKKCEKYYWPHILQGMPQRRIV